jgi:hypothetical protein
MDQQHYDRLITAIEAANHSGFDWVAFAAMAATVVLAVCAIAALVYSKGQLDQIVKSNRDAAQTERARFLFNVDEMFENWHFASSRAAFAGEIEGIWTSVRGDYKDAPSNIQTAQFKDRFSKRLFHLMENDTRQYTRLMKLCGFFETLEILIKNGFIDEAHVIDLYRPALVRVADACTDHIQKRREMDPERDRALFENFLALATRARVR